MDNFIKLTTECRKTHVRADSIIRIEHYGVDETCVFLVGGAWFIADESYDEVVEKIEQFYRSRAIHGV